MLGPPKRSSRSELLDLPHPPPEDLRESLRDLESVNLRWGGLRPVLARLRRRLRDWPRGRTLRALDVGTGGADLPRALASLCRRLGIPARIVALDRSSEVLSYARDQIEKDSTSLVRGDALTLPFLPGSFDFVFCTLLLHHIMPADAAGFLASLSPLARVEVIVSDLRRGRWEYWCTRVFSRTLLRGRMSFHDAPLSVLRALTPSEALELIRAAGWTRGRVEKVFPLRILLMDRGAP